MVIKLPSSSPIPGAFSGIPGAETPLTEASARSLRTTLAGTGPSTSCPVVVRTPVWHELSSIGTPSFFLIDTVSVVLIVVTSKPAFFIYSTHAPQHLQFG